VKSLFRAVPSELRRGYIQYRDAELAGRIDWNRPDADLLKALQAALTESSREVQEQVQADADRIKALADEPGQAAMRSVMADTASLEALPGDTARALSLFLDDPTCFRRAEEIRYTDERRRGKMWDGFVGPSDKPLAVDAAALKRLKAVLRERFDSEKIQIEVFERSRIGSQDAEYRLLQMTIYREGWPGQVLEFVGEEVAERSYRPVYEAAITYEPTSGAIEVVANEKKAREDLASLFCSEVLATPFTQERLPLRRFDLSVLKQAYDFPVDAEDRIENVRVAMLRLMPLGAADVRLVLEMLATANDTIWTVARSRLGSRNPLDGPWVITQTRLVIQFCPEPGARRGRTLPIVITMPHSSDLKDRTARERLVGQKYLVSWGLLQEIGNG
jgi:hypothetical protein